MQNHDLPPRYLAGLVLECEHSNAAFNSVLSSDRGKSRLVYLARPVISRDGQQMRIANDRSEIVPQASLYGVCYMPRPLSKTLLSRRFALSTEVFG